MKSCLLHVVIMKMEGNFAFPHLKRGGLDEWDGCDSRESYLRMPVNNLAYIEVSWSYMYCILYFLAFYFFNHGKHLQCEKFFFIGSSRVLTWPSFFVVVVVSNFLIIRSRHFEIWPSRSSQDRKYLGKILALIRRDSWGVWRSGDQI